MSKIEMKKGSCNGAGTRQSSVREQGNSKNVKDVRSICRSRGKRKVSALSRQEHEQDRRPEPFGPQWVKGSR